MKAQVRMEDHSTDISKLKLQEKIILPPKPEKPAVMHPHEAYPLPAADEWSFPKIWPQRFLISHTETERTSHQNQLKWEEMQSPKYLSYLDLGLLTNLHWDMVTHCSTWREKQCLLKFKKKKKITEIEAPESTVVSCHSLNCSSPFFFFSAKHRNAFQW